MTFNCPEFRASKEHITLSIEFDTEEEAREATCRANFLLRQLGLKQREPTNNKEFFEAISELFTVQEPTK